VGLLGTISRWFGNERFDEPHSNTRRLRICRFEEYESRQLMAADLHVGSVYYEQAAGDDLQPNLIQFKFEGGAAGTQLTQIVIDGDKDGQGISSGDVFFDTAPGGHGVFRSNPFKVVSSEGFTVKGVQVVDGGMRMVIDLEGFDAGELLVISVDVDEFQFVQGNDVDVNAVAEGGEFQRSHFHATFKAPHYHDLTTHVQYWDAFNQNFAQAEQASGLKLNLPPDRFTTETDFSDMTAGAVAVAEQEALPNSISGVVYLDHNLNNSQDSNDTGIGGVNLTLLRLEGNQYVSTGLTTLTDAQGRYKFDDLDIGTYRVVETQPSGFRSVGATPGKVAGQTRGVVTTVDVLSGVNLLGGEDSVRNDFAEYLPVSIAGRVHVSDTGDCSNHDLNLPLAGVTIHLLDASGNIIDTVITGADGRYKFDDLRPGTYGVREIQPLDYFNGGTFVGSAGGTKGDDLITNVVLTSGIDAVNYDFCEIPHAGISGYVYVDMNDNGIKDPNEAPIGGVTLMLKDANGVPTGATTTTNASGYYEFTGLRPGTYGVGEVQPTGFLDGLDSAGSAGGSAQNPGDMISGAKLIGGIVAVNYNFGEILPARLSGYVYVDWNNNGIKEDGEQGIAGVTVYLKDANGDPLGVTVTTDANGMYLFDNLRPGTYGVGEIQPDGYFDGLDTPGTAGGTAMNPGDMIAGAVLPGGKHGENYNFGELPPASIQGHVNVNCTGDCENHDKPPLSGVTVHLLDSSGNIVDTAITGADGRFHFTNLAPGQYSVQEIQPIEFFDGGTFAGSAGGQVTANLISNIVLVAGLDAVDYHFCEIPPAMLSGHVFQDGPPIQLENPGDVPDVLALRDGLLTPDDTLLPGVVVSLRDGVTGLPIFGSIALPGFYAPDQPITTVTDSGGYYQFIGLPPGTYAVYEVRPDGFLPGIDTPGTTGGVVFSPLATTDPAILAALVELPSHDALLQIPLSAGQHSADNNFSVVTTFVPDTPQIILPPAPAPAPPPPAPGFFPLAPPVDPLLIAQTPFLLPPILTRGGGAMYTWHLSVVDAGYPRGVVGDDGVQLTSVKPEDLIQWSDDQMDDVEWTMLDLSGETPIKRKIKFGMKNGIPISGDFNGDGQYEVGVFKDGFWFIDLNDNGVWDAGDLWAKLGHQGDRPVTGDWDGDGKTDIGIYGPAWSGDPRAIAHEPGMPDPHNPNTDKHKNIAREQPQNTIGNRTLKRTADGKPRSDLIDHVFLYGTPGDHPLVGDWNGDGVDTIAVFRDGIWRRDTNGDGKHTDSDHQGQFGHHGDKPLSGDFNGDGIDEIAIFRDGTWYIDSNNNGVIDDDDLVLQLGKAGDIPVVGDWNGDGRDEPAVFHDQQAARTARR